MQTVPCRRRPIWAAQSVTNLEIKHEQENKARVDANSSLQEVNYGRRDHSQEVQAGANEARREEAGAVEANPNKDKSEAKEVNPHQCDKCGKEVRRGMYFHRKYCKG